MRVSIATATSIDPRPCAAAMLRDIGVRDGLDPLTSRILCALIRFTCARPTSAPVPAPPHADGAP